MAMKESGNRTHKWLATPLMLTLMAGISSIARAQDEGSGSPESTDGVPLSEVNHQLASPIAGTWENTNGPFELSNPVAREATELTENRASHEASSKTTTRDAQPAPLLIEVEAGIR